MLEQLRPSQNDHTLLSPRIPRDTEHERYHPELEEELKECLFCLKRNEMMFDMEVDTDLIEQRIYERQALLCRYRYLLARARELGLHTVLTAYQPHGRVKGLANKNLDRSRAACYPSYKINAWYGTSPRHEEIFES